MRISLIPFVCFLLFLASCNNQPEIKQEQFKYDKSNKESREVKEVIYSMYLPTDITEIFASSGINYNPDIPAPTDQIIHYRSPEQIALMLGVYGVDITYMKLLGQNIPAAQYYQAIESLSKELDIPSKIFERTSKELEKYFRDEDSLAVVIDRIYTETDKYYKENNMDNYAALSLAGGWIEAMHIGVEILEGDSTNYDMSERLLQQKYSLNSIYTLLSNHQESIQIKKYLLMLKKLRKVYEQVDIFYEKEGFSLDTTQKKIQTLSAKITYEKETLNELTRLVNLIRNEMIEIE